MRNRTIRQGGTPIRRLLIAAVASAVVVGPMAATPAVAAIKSCSSATPVSARPLVLYGDRGSCVRVLQQRLLDHGVSVGAAGVDGIFGPSTLRGVRTFQGRQGLLVDGLVGPNTWAALVRSGGGGGGGGGGDGACQPRQTIRYGSTGTCVRVAQDKLNDHGAGLLVDGIFGSNTRSATISYQRSVGLVADGIIGPRTWSALDAGQGGDTGGGGGEQPSGYNPRRGPNYSGAVVLSFDDCPSSVSKLQAGLDWLERTNIGAWFFPTGNCITGYRNQGVDIVAMMRSHGQLVGNHTVSHPDLTTLSYSGMVAQLRAPGVVTNFGRPPYGASNGTVLSAYRAVGMTQVYWSVDTRDWTGKSSSEVVDYVVGNAEPGDTVLMHMQWNGFTPSAMAAMTQGLNNRGILVCRQSYDYAPQYWPSSVDCT